MGRTAGRKDGGAVGDRPPAGPIRAAGCVLWRRAPGGDGIQLALVHRPKWGDWSHPKGKLKPREDPRRGALREVLEETGATCEIGPELPTVRYLVGGRPKEVRYWAAEATGGGFIPNKEVDRMLWLPPDAARDLLTRDRDRELVAALLSALHATGRVPDEDG
ncbi:MULTISPECIES: NUDIX hydrolase [Streptomyces]|uniref:NUDIX hydrolase n=1 Tax=Streptomyces TaxID=1883 RepID=UPI0019647249|nr:MULTISPECIES: NUDIX hydrolase [Streptomyces]QRX93708.1 NUDIX hydrolase [Streptomyces noursei]UJB43384.1 NUDIX hydrolase [Streptomyces sp. A1-5]